MQSPPTLRNYQEECIDALKTYRRRPATGAPGVRALVAMATGLGKTIIFCNLPALAQKRVLMIAHREELLVQTAGHMALHNPDKTVGIEQADRHAGDADIVVASIQTLSSRDRLKQFRPEDFSLVIYDEAHHAVSPTAVGALNWFGLAPDLSSMITKDRGRASLRAEVVERLADYKPTDSIFLAGFTATPHRTDGMGLEGVFDEIVYSMTIEQGIDQGWLCPIRGQRVRTETDISGVKTRLGDYVESDLSETVNTEERNLLAARSYIELAKGRQALVFCVDVAHSYGMADAWNSQGIATQVVVGGTPPAQRREIITAYRAGHIKAIANCMVLTEGFDAPQTSCIVMARPTKSGLIYTQAMGRGTRIAPGKDNLLVIDMVDLAAKGATVQTLNTLFGLPPQLDTGGADVSSAKRAVARIVEGVVPAAMLEFAESLGDIEVQAREFNPLKAAAWDPALSKTQMSWVPTTYGYALSAMDQGLLGVVVDLLGHVAVRVQKKHGITQELETGFTDAATALAWAEAWLTGEDPNIHHALRRNAKWHQEPPTEKQLAELERLKVFIPDDLTRGWASALISRAMGE